MIGWMIWVSAPEGGVQGKIESEQAESRLLFLKSRKIW